MKIRAPLLSTWKKENEQQMILFIAGVFSRYNNNLFYFLPILS